LIPPNTNFRLRSYCTTAYDIAFRCIKTFCDIFPQLFGFIATKQISPCFWMCRVCRK